MTDETTSDTPDHDEATEAPARPRVPNVRPGAVSGLDNVLLNPDEDAAAEQADGETVPDEPDIEPTPDAGSDQDLEGEPDTGSDSTGTPEASTENPGGESTAGEDANSQDPDSPA